MDRFASLWILMIQTLSLLLIDSTVCLEYGSTNVVEHSNISINLDLLNAINLYASRAPFPCYETSFDSGQITWKEEADDKCFLVAPENETRWNASYFIVQQPIESDYIETNLKVCGKFIAQVYVYDENSKKMLNSFTFDDERHSKCLGPRHFISDSNKIRIEYPAFYNLTPSFEKTANSIEFNFKDDQQEIILHLILNYESLEFQEYEFHVNSSSQSITIDKYIPNSVWNYVVDKVDDDRDENGEESKEYKIGVIIEIEYLDLDFDKDDFLLISPGVDSNFWVNTKGQLVTKRISGRKERFWVNADSAFVKVVTHNSKKPIEKVLKANFIQANTTVKRDKDLDVPNRIRLASMQLCFYESCNLWKTRKLLFVKEFVHYLNNYLIYKESNISILVDESLILIFDVESHSLFSVHNQEMCRISLAVISPYDSQYPLVARDVLYQMFFNGAHERSIFLGEEMVTDCSESNITYFKIIMPILAIILISTVIVILFWRLQDYFMKIRYKPLNPWTEAKSR